MKTHYRKVFKSDHLGIADLEEMIEEGKDLIFTIKEVKSHLIEPSNKKSGVVVAGRRISANIAYFIEDIKPLVLNSTNSKRVRAFNGGSVWVEDWANTTIELYADYGVKMKGDTVGGVRIKTQQPTEKKKPILSDERFTNAVNKIKDGTYTKDKLIETFDLTIEQLEVVNG